MVGNALKEIRDSKLYREDYKTFEKYVSDKWKMQKSQAYRLIDSSVINQNLSHIVGQTSRVSEIVNPRQLCELKDVPDESMEQVVERAAEIAGNDKITASDLKQARQEVLGEVTAIAKDDELVFRDVDDDDDDWTANERDRRSLVEKGFSVVANQSKDKSLIAWAHSQGLAVKVDRSSKYGNPFILDQDGDRDEVCDKYEKSYLPIKPSILNDVERLKGKVLICHCYPLRCHGDCLANTANQIEKAQA